MKTPKEKEITTFIKGNLTFWKCSCCNGWHEGMIYKCPLKQANKEIKELKMMYAVRNDDAKDYSKYITKLQSQLKEKDKDIKDIFDKFECFLGNTYLSRKEFEKLKKKYKVK